MENRILFDDINLNFVYIEQQMSNKHIITIGTPVLTDNTPPSN